MALLPTQAFYLLINNKGLGSMSLTMAQVYKEQQDEDGFLYMTYASQEMFGHWPHLQTLARCTFYVHCYQSVCCKYEKKFLFIVQCLFNVDFIEKVII